MEYYFHGFCRLGDPQLNLRGLDCLGHFLDKITSFIDEDLYLNQMVNLFTIQPP